MEILQVLEGLAYVGFIAGAVFAVIELRTMSTNRRTELLLRTIEFYCSRDFEDVAARFMKARFKTPQEAEEQIPLSDLLMLADYHDFIGFMIKERLVPRNLALDSFGFDYAWDKIKPWARGEEIDDPMMREYLAVGYRYFEWAADEKRRRRLEKPQSKVS